MADVANSTSSPNVCLLLNLVVQWLAAVEGKLGNQDPTGILLAVQNTLSPVI